MRFEIRRLAREMGSVIYQGSRILQIHLFDICTASLDEGNAYLAGVNLGMLVRQCFRGSAHNWCPTIRQPGTPHPLQRDHVDTVIHNWRSGGDFSPVHLPVNANNILTDEVNHWIQTNLTVYSSVRTVLHHCAKIINWEFSEYDVNAKLCNRHATELVKHRQHWMPHAVNGVACGCSANNMIPWLVDFVANLFPLADDNFVAPGEWSWCWV